MSGALERMDRWTASETWSVSLTAWTSLAQNAENCATFRRTWSASSRVGTRIRAAVDVALPVCYVLAQICNGTTRAIYFRVILWAGRRRRRRNETYLFLLQNGMQ